MFVLNRPKSKKKKEEVSLTGRKTGKERKLTAWSDHVNAGWLERILRGKPELSMVQTSFVRSLRRAQHHIMPNEIRKKKERKKEKKEKKRKEKKRKEKEKEKNKKRKEKEKKKKRKEKKRKKKKKKGK